MQTLQKRLPDFLFFVLISTLILGCNSNETGPDSSIDSTAISAEPGVVTITTESMNFIVPEKIPSGFTSFRYINNSSNTHFFILEKMPAGKTLADSKKEVIPVFQKAMDSINAGKVDAGMAVFGELPSWFSDIEFLGGTGLIAPGKTAQTSFHIDTGLYVIECYVKMADGTFHSALGMVAQMEVTAEKSKGTIPTPTADIHISGSTGIELPEKLPPGQHTIAVHFKDQKAHENFLGHDVHLAMLHTADAAAQLEAWMNWINPKGFVSPTPESFTFLGGTQEMPAGSTAYFTVNLEPGEYAFISEVPDASKKNMLKTFSVSSAMANN